MAVIRKDQGLPPTGDRGAPATLEPITIPLTLEDLDEVHERWIEIRRLPDRSLVTVIEILSPSNKIGSGRIEYIEKRNQWIRQPVNLVEIDLLLQRAPNAHGSQRFLRRTISLSSRAPIAGLIATFTPGPFVTPCRSSRFQSPILIPMWVWIWVGSLLKPSTTLRTPIPSITPHLSNCRSPPKI